MEFYNQNKPVLDLSLVICGTEVCIPEFKMPNHLREYYLIHYVKSGTVIFEESNRVHTVNAGDIFVIYPENLTKYYNGRPDTTLEFCWIGFAGNSAEACLEKAGITRSNPVMTLNNTEFEETTEKMVKLFGKKTHPSEFVLNSYILRCLHSIEKSVMVEKKEYANYVESAVAYIEDNYMKAVSANDIVDFIKLNRSYLFKLFKQQTGLSVSQYLIKYRIDKACEFLKEYDFTISQVAQMVGIDDIYYFSKIFKRIVGVSPSEYKKRQDS